MSLRNMTDARRSGRSFVRQQTEDVELTEDGTGTLSAVVSAGANVDLAVGYRRNCELHGVARGIAGALRTVPEFDRKVGRVVGVQDCGAGNTRGVRVILTICAAVDGPDDSVDRAGRRNGRSCSRKSITGRGSRTGRGVEQARCGIEVEGRERATRRSDVQTILPEGRCCKDAAAQGEFLDDDAAVACGIEVAEVVAVDDVEFTIKAGALAAADDEVRERRRQRKIDKNGRSARTEIKIVGIQVGLIKGTEPVSDCEVAGEFNETVSVRTDAGVKIAFASDDEEFVAAIDGWCSAGHPDAALPAIRRCVEFRHQRQGSSVKAHDPAMVRRDVSVRSPSDVDDAIDEHQPRPLIFAKRAERNVPAGGTATNGGVTGIRGSGNRNSRSDVFWRADFLRAVCEVKCVQTLVIGRAFLAFGNDV